MALTDITIAAKATGTGQSSTFDVQRHPVTVQIYPGANLSGATADLQRLDPDGTYVDVYDENGKVTLSDTRPQEVVYGTGTFRLNFTARASAVGASYSTSTG